ncbi:dephospho-CoA kinase [Litorimonas sp. WD9-15]|uniref:dephospho-CoA kinase n=1 Tax=Litorimonas sp. WD9-15 TaxID=3418716 RepID=UPI003D022D3D
MKIIGLTGSIGMGKSTTAQMFSDLGCPVFDADATVHKMYAKGGRAVPLIRAVFPDAIVDGAVDRKVLGHHMRADSLNLKVLESFIHPWVGEARTLFLTQAKQNGVKAVIFDVPLLFETGGDKKVDATVVVTAPAEVQRARVMSRPGMTKDLFDMILSKQMPDAEKRRRADYIISTAEGLDAARKAVKSVLDDIL